MSGSRRTIGAQTRALIVLLKAEANGLLGPWTRAARVGRAPYELPEHNAEAWDQLAEGLDLVAKHVKRLRVHVAEQRARLTCRVCGVTLTPILAAAGVTRCPEHDAPERTDP